MAHLEICSTDIFCTNGAYTTKCATDISVGPTRRVVDKISWVMRGAYTRCAINIMHVSGAYWVMCATDKLWAPLAPPLSVLCVAHMRRVHSSEKVAELSVAHFL